MKVFEQYITLLEDDDYAKASILLEDIWRIYKKEKETQEEALLIKGLVNASFALEMRRMGKYNSFKLLLLRYDKYKPLINTLEVQNIHIYKKIDKLLQDKIKNPTS